MITNINKEIGKRIQFYRIKKNITVNAFAQLIGKNAPTVYKYESGTIHIDINTLYLICQILQINFDQLTGFLNENSSDILPTDLNVNTKHLLYLYHYNGRQDAITHSMIKITSDEYTDISTVNLYYGITDGFDYTQAQYCYHGGFSEFDHLVYFQFENDQNKAEHITLVGFNPWNKNLPVWGIFTGILTNTIAPSATKILLSPHSLPADELTKEFLAISKKDIAHLKKINALTVDFNANIF